MRFCPRIALRPRLSHNKVEKGGDCVILIEAAVACSSAKKFFSVSAEYIEFFGKWILYSKTGFLQVGTIVFGEYLGFLLQRGKFSNESP